MRLLKPYNLSGQQYNVLKILREKYPETCTLSLVSGRLVDKLLKKRMATRNLCADNHRKVDIRITPAGLELLKKLEPGIDKTIAEMIGTKSDAVVLNSLLIQINGRKIENNLENFVSASYKCLPLSVL